MEGPLKDSKRAEGSACLYLLTAAANVVRVRKYCQVGDELSRYIQLQTTPTSFDVNAHYKSVSHIYCIAVSASCHLILLMAVTQKTARRSCITSSLLISTNEFYEHI